MDRTQKWISVAPKTKATHTDVYTLVCEANETGTFRSAEVDVINTVTGETPEVFYVLQYPAETVTTDIASLENVADNTPVALYKETVLASSEKSAVVSDGTSYLVVTGLETALPVGKEITLNGVKNTDAETDLVSLTYTSHEVSAETSAVTNPAPVYIGMAYYTIPSYTIASGKLSQSEGVYYITAPMGQTVVFEAPSASFSLASKVGSYVSAYGYVVDYAFTGEDDPETDTMILTAISTVEFKENNAWTLSYSTDPEDADYPEVITNTVSGSTVPYTLGLYSAEGYAEIGGSPVAAALLLGDDLQYYFDLYGDAFDRDELYSIFVHGDGATGSDSFKEIAYGKYVAIAAGIAADGTPTGDYKVFEFEKEKPESSEAYKAWLGNYTISTKSVKTGNDTTYNVVLADGVPDKTILINGLGIDGFPVQYDAENDKCSVVFGKFKGNSSYDFYVSGITNDNYVCTGDPDSGKIATLTKSADRTIKVENVVYKLSDERSEVYAAYWGILAKTAANKWYTFSDVNYVVNPATMTPAAATKAIKSVSAPNACQSVRFDSKTLPAPDTKCGKVDARIAKSGRASLLELK